MMMVSVPARRHTHPNYVLEPACAGSLLRRLSLVTSMSTMNAPALSDLAIQAMMRSALAMGGNKDTVRFLFDYNVRNAIRSENLRKFWNECGVMDLMRPRL